MTATIPAAPAPAPGAGLGRLWVTEVPSPIGQLRLHGRDTGPDGPSGPFHLCGLYLTGHRHDPGIPGGARRDRQPFAEAAGQLEAYFAGVRTRFQLALAPAGTAFQQLVWAELDRIPFGETVTYGELARRIDRPAAVRAVGAANGRNPISIVLPCHRVLGADGSLTGYAGGTARKRFLLDHELRVAAAR